VTASVPGASKQEAARRGMMGRESKATFPRSARLLRHADFERVYKQGRRHFSPSMTVFYLQRSEVQKDPARTAKGEARVEHPQPGSVGSGMRVGFTVGKALGGAVVRNRMKRRLREAVRLTRRNREVQADVVINPKNSLLTADFVDVLNEVRRAFEVIEEKIR
jgi:ribonuclease P protein component